MSAPDRWPRWPQIDREDWPYALAALVLLALLATGGQCGISLRVDSHPSVAGGTDGR